MKGHLNDILKFEASPYEVSWNLMKGKLDIGEWSWIINTCWWVWLSFKFQNFTAPFSEKVNAHLPLINTDKILWNQFEREKLSSYFTMFRKKNEILVTIFTNHNAVWNSKSRVAVQFNLLSYNSLLYPYIIFFVRRSNVSTCNLHITSGHQFNSWQKSTQQIALDSSLGLEAFYVMSTSDKFANTWLFVWFTTMAFPKRTWLLWKQL